MKKYVTLLLLPLLLGQSCSDEKGYTLEGMLRGMDKGRVLIQEYKGKGVYENIDSAEISEGKFVMKGSVEHPRRIILGIDGKRSKASFWIENSRILVTAHADSLYMAEITGSVAQQEYLDMREVLDGYDIRLSKMYRELAAIKREGNEQEIRNYQQQVDSAQRTKLDAIAGYIRMHPESHVAATMIGSSAYFLDGEELEHWLSYLSPEVASTPDMTELKKKAERMKLLAAGNKAPDFELNDPEGNPVKLYSLLQNCELLLLDFWAGWCMPCRNENPWVLKTYNKYHDKGFDVLGVSLDRDKESWLKAIEEDGLVWTHVSNLNYWDNPVVKQYAVSAIPTNYLIDKNGTILGKNLKGFALDDQVRFRLGE